MGTSRTQGRRWPAAVALAIGFAVVLIASTALAADPKRNLAVSKPAAPAAAGERRVALVIGNGAYKDAPLKKPRQRRSRHRPHPPGSRVPGHPEGKRRPQGNAGGHPRLRRPPARRRRRALLLRRPRHAGEGPQLFNPGQHRHPARGRGHLQRRGRQPRAGEDGHRQEPRQPRDSGCLPQQPLRPQLPLRRARLGADGGAGRHARGLRHRARLGRG